MPRVHFPEIVFQPLPARRGFQDITGQEFERLTVLGYAGQYRWFCECKCSRIITTKGWLLRSRDSRSCGCYSRDAVTSHGCSFKNGKPTPEYSTWQAMNGRCANPNNQAFSQYGGRGITVCERWQNSFENFLADMGERPAGKTLDRIDNNKGYSPDNCRWATKREQSLNRRDNRTATYKGETLSVGEWASRLGMKYITLSKRLRDGWTHARAIETPVRKVTTLPLHPRSPEE